MDSATGEDSPAEVTLARRAELSEALDRVHARIAKACANAGRAADEVTLIAVTKTYPASDVRHLIDLGVRDVGENRDTEAAPKAAAVSAAPDVRWHFIGQLQRNKCRSVVGYAGMVQSVDRPVLVTALADAVGKAEAAPLDVLIQLSLDGDPARGGVSVAELPRLAEAVAARPELALRGLMAVAPVEWEPARAFEVLARHVADFRVRYPTATVLSTGMSGDLVEAIQFGATHVRVGSALLGSRTTAGLA